MQAMQEGSFSVSGSPANIAPKSLTSHPPAAAVWSPAAGAVADRVKTVIAAARTSREK